MGAPMLTAMILANKGQRNGRTPVGLQRLCGRPVLSHVLDALGEIKAARVLVVVPADQRDLFEAAIAEIPPLMTCDIVDAPVGSSLLSAALTGVECLNNSIFELEDSHLLLLPDDRPLLRSRTYAELVDRHVDSGAAASMLTFDETHPEEVGPSRLLAALPKGSILEHDKSGAVRGLRSVPTVPPELEREAGVFCVRGDVLGPSLRLARERALFTGDAPWAAVAALGEAGHPLEAYQIPDQTELISVSGSVGRTQADFLLRRRINRDWQRRGVMMLDSSTTYIDAAVKLGIDVTIYPNTILEGSTVIEDGAQIGPAARLVDCFVGSDAKVERTTGHGATIGRAAEVGPFASLEPGGVVADGLVTGSFYTASGDK